MTSTIEYCVDCGKQVVGSSMCLSCQAQTAGMTIVHCRECNADILVRDLDQADAKSLVCDPCERHLMREMMSPMPYDSPFTGEYGELMDDDLAHYHSLHSPPGILPTGERVEDMD